MSIFYENWLQRKRVLSGIISFVTIAITFIALSGAQLLAEDTSGLSGQVDAVLLLDGSGSMRLTDPQKLRFAGARAFIDSRQPGDRIALVEFSESAKLIRGLTDRNESDAIKLELTKVGDSGEYTDLLAGITLAREILNKDGRASARKVIVLLSDGKMDPKPSVGTPEEQQQKLFAEEIPNLKSQDIAVHTLAFSDLADQKLLGDIATMSGGTARFSATAEGLAQAFVSVSSDVSAAGGTAPTQVGNHNTDTDSHKTVGLVAKSFDIADGIDEATFYITRGNSSGVSIQDPTGAVLTATRTPDGVRWYRGEDFDLVTVTRPTAGQWGVTGIEKKEDFATVLTNLKLTVEWSTEEATVDEPIRVQAKFFESRKPIILPQLSKVLNYSYQIVPTDLISEPILRGNLHDDGVDGDDKADDGVYSAEFSIEDQGGYRLHLSAQGPTLTREYQDNFKIAPRMLTLALASGEAAVTETEHGHEEASAHHEEESHDPEADSEDPEIADSGEFFHISLSQLGQSVRDRTVKIKATNSSQVSFTIVLPPGKHRESEFLVPVTSLPAAGTYDVEALLGGTYKGKSVSASSNVLHYVYTGSTQPVTVKLEHSKEAEAPKKSEKTGGGSSILLQILLLTLANVAVGYWALTTLKKSLNSFVVEEEEYVAPEDALKILALVKERAEAKDLNLNDSDLSTEKIEQMLAVSSAAEEEFEAPAPSGAGGDGESIVTSTEGPKPIITEDSAPAAEGTTPAAQPETPVDPTTPEQIVEKVESEVDEETKKLLDSMEDQMGVSKE